MANPRESVVACPACARRARMGWEYAGDGSLGTVEIPGLRTPEEAAA